MAGSRPIDDSRIDLVCPYFMPLEKFENGSWPHPARLPLGAGWRGHCTAPGYEEKLPPQDILEAFCNLGYASGCAWAPAERAWDAVRFAVTAPSAKAKPKDNEEPAADGSRSVIRLHYVCERDHRPVTDGQLEFDVAQAVWLRRHDDPRVQKMAECFLEAQLKKRWPETPLNDKVNHRTES
jgi:hypothetical protein